MNSTKPVSQLITEDYQLVSHKPEIQALKILVHESRKYGFSLVCTMRDKDEVEQMHWAACLLLRLSNASQRDILTRLHLEPGTDLYKDARFLLARSRELSEMHESAVEIK